MNTPGLLPYIVVAVTLPGVVEINGSVRRYRQTRTIRYAVHSTMGGSYCQGAQYAQYTDFDSAAACAAVLNAKAAR